MIYQQSVFEPWPIESESVQAVITSPPYYALRKYDIPDVIIGGDKDCKHGWGDIHEINKKGGRISGDHPKDCNCDWCNGKVTTISSSSSSCIHCNAWKGQYGLEPTPQMYIEHTRLWAKEAWRVLRNDGIMFLNLADSYNGNKKGNTCNKNKVVNSDNFIKIQDYGISSKCQLLIPHRVAIGLVDWEDEYELKDDLTTQERNFVLTELTKWGIINNI